IAATNRDLERAMTEGSFRQDLFYRLNVVRVTLPPLRERREDIPSLINHFLRRFNKRFHRDVRGVAPEALAALSAYTFPGNVRELENLIERAFAMGSREQIALTDLPSLSKTPMAATPVTSPESVTALADVERELILKALAVFKDDNEAAAKALGISRGAIYPRVAYTSTRMTARFWCLIDLAATHATSFPRNTTTPSWPTPSALQRGLGSATGGRYAVTRAATTAASRLHGATPHLALVITASPA